MSFYVKMMSHLIVALAALISFFGADSEIYVAKQGDTIELNCNGTKNVSDNYNYYNYGFTMFVNKNFNSDRMQIWPRTYYYNSEYYYSSGRFIFTSDSSNLVLSIGNLQFDDAGQYSCQYNSRDVSHQIIVIGREVNLSINGTGKRHSMLNDNSTILDCSFDISIYPLSNESASLEIEGAVGSNTTKEGFTIRRLFAVTSTRSRSFTCKVNFPFGIYLESQPVSFVLKDVKQEDENYVVRHGDSSFLLSCSSLHPSNKQWKWFKERLYYGNQLSFPIINCILQNSTEECFNQTSHHFLEDVSTQVYTFLRFTNITFEATGSYFCVDDLFTVQKLFNVIVVDATPTNMKINGQPVENTSIFEIKRGGTAIIMCSIVVASNEDEEGRYHPKLVVEGAKYVNRTVDGAYLVYAYETIINQSGSFNCFVEIPNDYQVIGNFSNYTINVNVFYCPENLEISSEMENGTLERGTILNCKTSSIPAANVTWSAANKVLKLEAGPNYANLRVYEKMVYTCQTEPTFHSVLGLCQPLVTSFEPERVIPRQYLEIPISVYLGEFLTLQCTTLYNKNNNWKWIQNWNPNTNLILEPLVDCLLQENVECSNLSKSGGFQDHSSSSETQLTLLAANLRDIGNYTCLDSLRTVIKSFKVNVFVCPSKLVISKKNVKGETELTCSVTSSPAVNVTWSLSNDPKPLAVGLNSAKLVVTQNGSYRCFVPQTSHYFLGKCGELSFIEIIESFPKK